MATSTPVLFIHGLWLHARSWDAWIDHFTAAGYDASAPGWPGDPDTVAEARERPGGDRRPRHRRRGRALRAADRRRCRPSRS